MDRKRKRLVTQRTAPYSCARRGSRSSSRRSPVLADRGGQRASLPRRIVLGSRRPGFLWRTLGNGRRRGDRSLLCRRGRDPHPLWVPGERFHAHGRVGSHPLKKLWQEWGVPPWERSRIPLVYYRDRLLAVAGYGVAAWAWTSGPALRVSLVRTSQPAHDLLASEPV